MDSAAALLTDPDKLTYTYTFQLPYLKIAWDELQEALVANGIVDVDEVTSPASTITAGSKEWTGQPSDLLFPIKLWEKAVGAPDSEYTEMDERTPDPSELQVEELENWYFQEGLIKFKGATTDRSIILKYQRELTVITGDATILPVANVKNFLAFRSASIIARARGNKSRADDLDADAKLHYDTAIGTKVKDGQGEPVKPRPYGWARRHRRYMRIF
jgi:hypothetical protein